MKKKLFKKCICDRPMSLIRDRNGDRWVCGYCGEEVEADTVEAQGIFRGLRRGKVALHTEEKREAA